MTGVTKTPVTALFDSPIRVELRCGNDPGWTPAELSLQPGGLTLVAGEMSIVLMDEELDGVAVADGSLFVHAGTGVSVAAGVTTRGGASGSASMSTRVHTGAGELFELRGSEVLAQVGVAIVSRVCVMREVTRPLRGFGARRGNPGDDHDKFFGALIEARRSAEAQTTAAARLSQFDSAAIQRATESTLHGFAATRYPADAPRRRALYEAGRELAEPLFTNLEKLAVAAAAVREAPAERRLARWREWQLTLDRTFAAADNSWLALIPVLDAAKIERPSRLRRLFRRTAD